MRATIESLGGEYPLSESRVDGSRHRDDRDGVRRMRGVVLAERRAHRGRPCGARDRPQRARYFPDAARTRRPRRSEAVLDRLSYRASAIADRPRAVRRLRGPSALGAADYKLVHHCRQWPHGYSFCMCPGGTVVAATSEPGRVVTNGMSQYSRNERNANRASWSASRRNAIIRAGRWRGSIFSGAGSRGLCRGRRGTTRRRGSGRRFSCGQAVDVARRVIPSYKPGVT